MAVKIKEYDGGRMIDLGDGVRIERRAMPEQEPLVGQDGKKVLNPATGEVVMRTKLDKDGNAQYKWIAYYAHDTGVEYHESHLKAVKSGGHRDENGNVRHEVVAKMGTHPVIKDKSGQGIETNEAFIWVPDGEFNSQEEALAHAKSLAGEGSRQ